MSRVTCAVKIDPNDRTVGYLLCSECGEVARERLFIARPGIAFVEAAEHLEASHGVHNPYRR